LSEYVSKIENFTSDFINSILKNIHFTSLETDRELIEERLFQNQPDFGTAFIEKRFFQRTAEMKPRGRNVKV
jgi:hypothetical protein